MMRHSRPKAQRNEQVRGTSQIHSFCVSVWFPRGACISLIWLMLQAQAVSQFHSPFFRVGGRGVSRCGGLRCAACTRPEQQFGLAAAFEARDN